MAEPMQQEPGARYHILFVDDEPNIVHGLRRAFRPMRHVWDMHYVTSGQEALRLLAHTSCDVIVSDMRMPTMDGVQLLTEVWTHFPQTVRILLSGQANHERIVRSATLAHQYLSKPCDTIILWELLQRVCSLPALLAHAPLQRRILRMQTFPSLPSLYDQCQAALAAPEASLDQVGQYIERDIGMTLKVLQLVHSSLFGASPNLLSPREAVHHLGWETLKALVQTGRIFSSYDREQVHTFSLDALWHHSTLTGLCAQRLASAATADQQIIAYAYLAGLFHDIGKVVLAIHLSDEETRDLVHPQATVAWDHLGCGATPAAVGAYLLRLWGIPEAIVTAVMQHSCPATCPTSLCHAHIAAHLVKTLLQEMA